MTIRLEGIGLTVGMFKDLVCPTTRALFPQRACSGPSTYDQIKTLNPVRQSDGTYSINDLHNMAKQLGDEPSPNIRIPVLFLDNDLQGVSTNNGGKAIITGYQHVQYGKPVIAIFLNQINNYTDAGWGGLSTIETMRTFFTAISIVHESGHVYGLVNGDIPLQSDHQQDAVAGSLGGHCRNETCTMNFKRDFSGVFDRWITAVVSSKANDVNSISFCDECIRDVVAAIKKP